MVDVTAGRGLRESRLRYVKTLAGVSIRYQLFREVSNKSCERPKKKPDAFAPGSHKRFGKSLRLQSGRQDSNLRHLAPKASALPNCATPRRIQRLAVDVQTFSQVDAAADRSLCSPEARPLDPVSAESNCTCGAPLQLFWQRVVEGP